jgi:hypothetical protein
MAVPIRARFSGWLVGGPGVKDQAGGDVYEEGRRSSGFTGVDEAYLALVMRSGCVPQKARLMMVPIPERWKARQAVEVEVEKW